MPGGAPSVYIMIVTLPASMPQEIDPYSLPPRRSRRWDVAAILRSVAYIAVAFAVTWGAWQMFAPAAAPTLAGAPVEVGGMALDKAAGAEQSGEWLPAIRWPWQEAQETAGAVQEAADAVGSAVTAVLWLLGLIVVGLILWFARGFMSTVLGAVGSIFNRR
jgi:hypothetical protein